MLCFRSLYPSTQPKWSHLLCVGGLILLELLGCKEIISTEPYLVFLCLVLTLAILSFLSGFSPFSRDNRDNCRMYVQFPANVTNRTEAIAHRIATAGIYRKVADNQVKALRFILSGSHEDMLQLESDGRLEEWCHSTMQWLYTTFGKANVVAATLHADEETPHIHATVVPIVTGERRKAKQEAENGKRKYKTKKNKIRLCADDLLTPKKLEEYQTSYAEQMRPFGLSRGVQGSEAKHRTNMEYYKELLKETKQKQLEEEELIQKVRELEKQAGKLRVKGTLYSLFGNSELDKAEQRIEELEQEVKRQQHLSEKEKAEIRKEVIILQDTIRDKDKTISEQHREIKVLLPFDFLL